MNALDCENATTSWNSDGSSSGKKSSSFLIDFGRMVQPVELRLQFQAGFAAESIVVLRQNPATTPASWEPMIDLEAEDDHDMQEFPLYEKSKEDIPMTKSLKLIFDECTDFYGRITIYQFQVWGREVALLSEEEAAKYEESG
jgi:hypothetical protein